jgi:PIN domain nuclease of toxin-antitoxin system
LIRILFCGLFQATNNCQNLLVKKIKDIDQSCFLSAASLWEITIKLKRNKLDLGITLEELFEFIDRNQIEIIPIHFEHLLVLSNLQEHHNDPFDRLMIAQALAEDLIIITRDRLFKNYGVKTIWK